MASSTHTFVPRPNSCDATTFASQDQTETADVEMADNSRPSEGRISNFSLMFSEFMGTLVLVVFGLGVNCQFGISNSSAAKAPFGSISLGWGIGAGLGVWVANHSGGHINPAITLASAAFRKFPWKKVPYYILAQFLGALVGSAVVYAQYFQTLKMLDASGSFPGTAAFFATYAAPELSAVSCFFAEFWGTALLVFLVFCIVDTKPQAGLVPLGLFMIFVGESAGFGFDTAFAINPARDFGPRLMTYMVGYGAGVWNYRHQYWLWVGIVATTTGGLAGGLLHRLFVSAQSGELETAFYRNVRRVRLRGQAERGGGPAKDLNASTGVDAA